MKPSDTLNIAFSLLKMKQDVKYDATKYEYVVPKHLSTQKHLFEKANGYELFNMKELNKNNTIVRLVYNYWICNNNTVKKVSDDDYRLFVSSLIEYKNEISIFMSKIPNDINPIMIYRMYNKNEIPFYLFYYILKYVKFNESIVNNLLIKTKILQVKQILKIFKHFDEEYIKEEMKYIQKIVYMNKV